MLIEALERGMAAALWAVGFIAVLGLFAMVVALICMLFAYVANGDEDEETKEEETNNDDTDD